MNVRATDQTERARDEDDRVAVLHGTPSQIKLDESPKQREKRLERTRAALDALRSGDPAEHRETLEILLKALGDEELLGECPGAST